MGHGTFTALMLADRVEDIGDWTWSTSLRRAMILLGFRISKLETRQSPIETRRMKGVACRLNHFMPDSFF